MSNLEEYKRGSDASASALLCEFSRIKDVVEACENVLLQVTYDDNAEYKWCVIKDALSILLALDDQLSICVGIADNVWGKVYRMEEERYHLLGKDKDHE